MLVISLLVLLASYGVGVARAWRAAGAGRAIRYRSVAAFALAWVTLAIALVSPLHELAEVWLSAHMGQHELLMLVAAPLMAWSQPMVAFAWAIRPRTDLKVIAIATRTFRVAPLAWLVHALVLWVWHIPAFYDYAATHEGMHALQHVSFFGSALVFWFALAHGRLGRLGYGAAVVYVFATAVQSSLLGALLTISPRVWFATYAGLHTSGPTPLEDQQLAGLLMWVPGGIVLCGAGLALLAAWLRESERRVRLTFPLVALALTTGGITIGCNRNEHGTPGNAGPAPQGHPAGVPPTIRLIADLPGTEWRTPAGDYGSLRYSTLDAINTTNVKNLRVITTFSTGIPHGHEGQPLVFNNTMYVVTPFPNNLIAVDLTKPGGAVKWVYEPHPDRRSVGIACCDIVNRGAAFGDNKIIYSLLDATVVAVNADSGAEEWRTKVGDINVGETFTAAPLVVKDKVLVGNSGAELGVRGYVAALDVKTGRELWRAFNTGPDVDVKIGPRFKAFYAKDQGADLGVSTWPPDQWKLGGSTTWGWMSYDPETNLFFYGTGNPGVWNPDLRPGDNKWSCAIIARDADTGEAVWAYQATAHDSWDYDEIMENILVDMEYGGRMRKLLIHPGRTGFMYVLDRETGELLSAETYQPTNWASSYDLKTGKPSEDSTKHTHFGMTTQGICPSSTGAKDVPPSAFSPRTGLVYVPAHNTCMDYTGIEANYIAGTPYLGADVIMYPGPGGYQGELVAWDVANNRKAWGVKEAKFPLYSGVLATQGDVLFYGTMDGWFKALDARTGTELWKFHVASGIVANPVTYLGPDGKQYVAVYSGIGGWMGATAFPEISDDDPYAALGVVGAMKDIKKYTAPGDTVYVFGF
jgi:lanthanide-dependent methanol dehydrogenase